MKVPQTMHTKQANRTFGSVLMNPPDRRQNRKQAFEASDAFSPVWVGCVSFPLTLPSPAGRGNTAPRAATSREVLDWRKRGRRFSLAPRERARVRGKPRSKHQCACQLPMNSATQAPCAPRFNAETPARPSAFDSPRSGGRFSLSPRERAGVRGKSLVPVDKIHAQPFDATRHPVPLPFPRGEGMHHRSVMYLADLRTR